MVSKYTRSQQGKKGANKKSKTVCSWRIKVVLVGLYLSFFVILGRLFYWQILEGSLLKARAQAQYEKTFIQQGQRGRIMSQEGHLLVGNTTRYRLVGYPHLITQPADEISQVLTEKLLVESRDYQQASESAAKATIEANLELEIKEKLNQDNARWISLMPQVSAQTKEEISKLEIEGLDFEPVMTRFYPEASMAAHITGFVGRNEAGQALGYFGLEGELNQELTGQSQTTVWPNDLLGFSFLQSNLELDQNARGRDIVTTLRRDLQHLAEKSLSEGLKWTGAKAGEIIILDPENGHILASASQPQYDPAHYREFSAEVYKNPTLTDVFEPGSIFKTLTVSAGIDAGVISPETKCPDCDGPRVIGQYTIRTWNDEYHPQITMREALAKSDNVAMIHVAEQLGSERFEKYLKDFGLGQSIGLDLQEDRSTPFPKKWGPVELATRSFGQGISVTSLQMIQAVGAIANDGLMMRPQIVSQVIEPDNKKIEVEPEPIRRVISSQTAKTVTEMMVHAAKEGEAQWTYSKNHSVAGKTGTSQIPDEGGGYKEDTTIASFIGFAPPEDPKFVMLVKLTEPQSSPWAAETAAPIWYQLAQKLFISLNIPVDGTR